MPERKPHILIEGFADREDFSSRRRGRNPVIPLQDRHQHGQSISGQYASVIRSYDARRAQAPPPITEDVGIYVEIVGMPDCELPLDSLDTSRDFKLRSCRKVDDHEVAVIFVPDSRRGIFQGKLEQYLDPDKDGKGGPRNHNLVDSIAEIKLADLQSFWTDASGLFPQDEDQVVWWELWLKKQPGVEEPLHILLQLAERIGAQLGNTSLTFFDSTVVLIRTSARQLSPAPELIANLEELRRAKETPNVLLRSSPKEQYQWVEDLNGRVQLNADISTAITILDTGVNYNHPVIGNFCNEESAERWDPTWPRYDNHDPTNAFAPYNDHGSKQAGLAVFGDLHEALMSHDPIVVDHRIESARILPPTGNNDPELYGAITVRTAEKLAIDRPDWKRVYSLAITSEPEALGGQPSSWSAEIDDFSFAMDEAESRLFVISAGNNAHVAPQPDCWDQVNLAQIEDPAQSWNALTVGAYTERTTNDDADFDGWSPLAGFGDVAPSSRSAVSWGWRKHAPYKPDVVEEGGNRLLSPDSTEVTAADVVSLLTTSGKTTGQLFEANGDTSAACALVSRQAAILMAEYPDYWPETIRALIVHSAEWTTRMSERLGLLYDQHSQKLAKETVLRTVGHGVPDLERARYSANHALTLIAQDELQPFFKEPDASASVDPKLHEMQLYQLPWPIEVLQQLPPELEVKLRVTLSYFIEPNPGRRGYRRRYSYQSHGLRFEVIRPGQTLANFRAFINQRANEETEDYSGPEGDNEGWKLGSQLRTRGSLHSDTWSGSAASLADMHTIAVYPVGGWWKYRTALDRWQNSVRFSLIVSIDVPDENVDIYSVVETQIETQVEIEV